MSLSIANGDERYTCAVVGSSPLLLNADYGAQIDSFDMVFRCNLAPTKGFERHVGDRTSHRFCNPNAIMICLNNQIYYEHSRFFPEIDRMFLFSLCNQQIIFKKVRRETIPGKLIGLFEQRNLQLKFLSDSELNLLCPNHPSDPTMGFIALMYALAHNYSVTLFGFDFYKSTRWHYFEKNVPYARQHDTNYEQSIIEELERKGYIRVCK